MQAVKWASDQRNWRQRLALRACLLALSTMASGLWAADIRIFSGGAPQTILRSLAPEFERESGHRVQFTFALVSAIQQRLIAGDQADLVLLPIALIEETARLRPMQASGRQELARVGIGVIAREGSRLPDISTPEAVRTMLLQAQAVALPDPSTPSGAHLRRVMAQLGIASAMEPKSLHHGAIRGGGELVAKGSAEFGLYLVSEVQTIAGVTVVGVLPPALQNHVVYASAIPADSSAPEAALSFIRFLSEPRFKKRWQASGFE